MLGSLETWEGLRRHGVDKILLVTLRAVWTDGPPAIRLQVSSDRVINRLGPV